MIDTHCHLTYPELSAGVSDVLVRARACGIVATVTIGTSAEDSRKGVELCRVHPSVRCAVGIHPHHAAEATDDDIALIESLAREDSVVAIGEIGLDYHYELSPRRRQREVFEELLGVAVRVGKPLVVHCREAFGDCGGILAAAGAALPKRVFHCFTGTFAEGMAVLDCGAYIGITGIVTFKKSDELRKVVAAIPGDRLLLETDAPFLSPEPVRSRKVNEPSLLVHVARRVADIRGVSVSDLDRMTSANAVSLFGPSLPL